MLAEYRQFWSWYNAHMERIRSKRPQRHFLKEWRDSKDLTQAQVAERLGTGKDTVSRYENNQRQLTMDVAYAFAQAFDPDLDALAMFRHPDEPSVDEKLRTATPEQRRAALTVVDTIMGTGTNG